MGGNLNMAYRMPKKIEDEYETRHGFRSSDLRPFSFIMIAMILVAIFFVKGIVLIALFLLVSAFASYYLLLPNNKGKHGASKSVRNWQIYYNFLFKDKHTYQPKELEENDEI